MACRPRQGGPGVEARCAAMHAAGNMGRSALAGYITRVPATRCAAGAGVSVLSEGCSWFAISAVRRRRRRRRSPSHPGHTCCLAPLMHCSGRNMSWKPFSGDPVVCSAAHCAPMHQLVAVGWRAYDATASSHCIHNSYFSVLGATRCRAPVSGRCVGPAGRTQEPCATSHVLQLVNARHRRRLWSACGWVGGARRRWLLAVPAAGTLHPLPPCRSKRRGAWATAAARLLQPTTRTMCGATRASG